MATQDYNNLDAFQMIIMLYFTIGMGFVFSWKKFFELDDCYNLFRLIRTVCFPAFIFREIVYADMTYFVWKPIIISALTILATRLIAVITSLIFRGNGIFLRFMQLSFSFSYINFFAYGYSSIKLLFGIQYEYICAIIYLFQCFIMYPIDVILMNTLTPESSQIQNPDEANSNSVDDPSAIEQISEIDNDKGLQIPLVPDNPFTSTSHTYIVHDKPPSLFKTILFSIISSSNIAAILAIIYNLIGLKVPVIIETYVQNFENLIFGTSLFFIGVAMWHHPLKGCNYLEVIPCLIMKHIVVPAIAGLFCWVFKFDKITANACILLFSFPTDSAGIGLLSRNNLEPNSITFTYIFSQILALPCFMLMITLFNEAHLFN